MPPCPRRPAFRRGVARFGLRAFSEAGGVGNREGHPLARLNSRKKARAKAAGAHSIARRCGGKNAVPKMWYRDAPYCGSRRFLCPLKSACSRLFCARLFGAGGGAAKNNFRALSLCNLLHINDIYRNKEMANLMQMKLFRLKIVQL